jgi:cephalosporin-C deacetylase-like acetyl esterase
MSEIHDLTYHGGGGFIYSEVWQMPIMTRRFHIRKINEFLEKKTEAEEKAMRGDTTIDAKSYAKNIQVPDFVSTVKKS